MNDSTARRLLGVIIGITYLVLSRAMLHETTMEYVSGW
jgi:hypothetical protein